MIDHTLRPDIARTSRLALFFICFASLGASLNAQAQTERDDYTRGSIFARIQQVDNATALSGDLSGEDEVSELQSRYGLTLALQQRTELTSVNLDYAFIDARFHEDSQPSENYWEGESRLNLGKDSSFFELDAFHTRRRVLNSPGTSPLLLTNSQDRQIYGISPLVRLGLGRANSVGLRYDYSEVDFGETEDNDSSRAGFDFIYTRYVSPIREVRVRIGQREVDYDTSDFADYETETLSVEMSAEHRRYDYQIALGVSELTPVQAPEESQNEAVGDFNLRYLAGANVFRLFANRSISDSSRGSGNDSFFSSEISYDSSIAERDQIVRTAAGLAWIYELLCGRCTLALNVGFEEADYLNLSRNDSEQRFFDISLGYDFSPQVSGTVGFRRTNTDFVNEASILDDTSSRVARLGLDYQANRNFSLAFFHERDDRSRADSDFVVNSTGITATLSFE